MTIPNLITIARLISVPVIVLLIVQHAYGWAFALFLAAGISDAVDGAIARFVRGQASELGAYLDPVADKALLVSIFMGLAISAAVPVWLAILVISRDVLIVGAVILSWMVGSPVRIEPLMVSKLNTGFQIAYIAAVLADLGLAIRLDGVVDVMTYVVAALTAASAGAYLIGWMRHMTGSPGER